MPAQSRFRSAAIPLVLLACFLFRNVSFLSANDATELAHVKAAQSAYAESLLKDAALRFEPNLGQADPSVKFVGRGCGYSVLFTDGEAVFVFDRPDLHSPSVTNNAVYWPGPSSPSFMRMRLKGTSADARIVALNRQLVQSNYFIGGDSRNWIRNVPGYSRVRMSNVRPGIDLEFYGHGPEIEYDLVLGPGAKPEGIVLEFSGLQDLHIDNELLTARVPGIAFFQHSPSAYQEINGNRRSVSVQYVLLTENSVGFKIGHYDPKWPLIVDPVLSYSTFLGGHGSDEPSEGEDTDASSVAVDSSGNVYVSGFTTSVNFPLVKPIQSANHGGSYGYDSFVLKISSAGKLLYSSYLGGHGNEGPASIAVDRSQNIYLAGSTGSRDFPVVRPLQGSNHGGYDVFLAKLDPTGSRIIYSTYLGGKSNDICHGIGIDPAGNAYVTGFTQSLDFPTMHPVQLARKGGDAFVAKLNPAGSKLIYSTYLGSANQDGGNAIAVDQQGDAYITGFTRDSVQRFPTTPGAFQRTNHGGLDAFITKLGPTGNILYSTLLGGRSDDRADAIAIDRSGNAYITGRTLSGNFPTKNAIQSQYMGGLGDVFVAELNTTGSVLLFSTYLGGSSIDIGAGITVGPSGYIYVVGGTSSTDFPVFNPLQPTNKGSEDVFLVRLRPQGAGFSYSTFIGGSSVDEGRSIALDSKGNIYVVGYTTSRDFPTVKPLQKSFGGDMDVIIVKVAPG